MPDCEPVRQATKLGDVLAEPAWEQTLDYILADSRRKQLLPSEKLHHVLSRFVSYVGSTSGVEQTFSQCLTQFRHLRNFKDPSGIQRILVLAGTRGQSLEADMALVAQARLIWAKNFEAPRQRKWKIKLCCIAKNMVRRGRHGQQTLLHRQRAEAADDPSVTSRLWGKEQGQELTRQMRLQQERKLDAMDMGILNADRQTMPQLVKYQQKQREAHKRHLQKHTKLSKAKLGNRQLILKAGTKTWIADADWDGDVQRGFATRSALRVTLLWHAQAFAVQDVTSPPPMVGLAASMIGGFVVSIPYFTRPSGPGIQYARALSCNRWVWISQACKESAPKTVDLRLRLIADARSSTAGCKWRLLDKDEFLARARASQRRRTAELVALTTAAERRSLPLYGKRVAMSLSAFASKCKRLRSL